jgi:hypothetical protein
LPDLVGNEEEAKFWTNIFERVYRGEIDTWDYQWVFANWLEGRATILPAVNLIKNIGFDANATHTTGSSDLANLVTAPITFPLKHPIAMVKSLNADSFSRTKCFQVPLHVKIRNKFAGVFQ